MTSRAPATSRWSGALAVAAVAAQIVYPLVSGSARDVVSAAVVVLLACAALAHAAATRGVVAAAAILVLTAGIGLASEIVGTATGFPFGCYDYASGRLGRDVAGVPLIVPLAWTAGVYPVWATVSLWARGVRRAAVTIVAVVGWDLYLDPQMVADGQWVWCSDAAGLPGLTPAGVPEIPYTNFLGWAAVAVAMAVALELLDRAAPRTPTTERWSVATVLFVWTWLGSALAHAVFLPQLGWSAVYGLVGMGFAGVPYVWWLARTRRPGSRAADGHATRAAPDR